MSRQACEAGPFVGMPSDPSYRQDRVYEQLEALLMPIAELLEREGFPVGGHSPAETGGFVIGYREN